MTTKRSYHEKEVTYFITFTCYKWINLIEQTETYDAFIKWFQSMQKANILILGYVIMPNHFHGLIHIPENSAKTINKVVGNGKRFIAYEIIKYLKNKKMTQTLSTLKVSNGDRMLHKGQIHRVFIHSFDCKEVHNLQMLETKLDYIHNNPVSGKWNLVSDSSKYPFSSDEFYTKNAKNPYLTHYKSIWWF